MIEEATTEIAIRPGKGQVHKRCICKHNIDITTGGCPIALDEGGNYKKENECDYCYAKYVHRNFVKNKQVNDKIWYKNKDRLETPIIRIGKMSEPGGRESRSVLVKVLELNNEIGTKTILVTRLLDWDEEVSRLLSVKNSVVHFSMGIESLEIGAIARGATNEFRIKQACRYKAAGNKVYLRIVHDVTGPIPDFIKEWEVHQIPFLVTPIRFFKKDLVSTFIPGETWESLKDKGRYTYSGGALSPVSMHPEWEKYNERCGHVGEKFYCNNCGL